jgi:hypothetical protein
VNNGTFGASNFSATAGQSVTITSNFGDLTASIGFTADSWKSPFTNRTLKWGIDAAEIGGDIGPGTGTTTHTWTDNYAFQTLAVSGANFKVIAAGPPPAGVSLSPASVTGGNGATGTVTLSSAAPSGGAVVTLSSDNVAATVPGTVTVATGATSATFPVATTTVSLPTTATITAVYNETYTAALTINPPVPTLTSVVMNPSSVTAGISSIGTVTLSSAAPSGGIVVTLSDNDSASTTPASVTVPAGATTATFTVTTGVVTTSTAVTITASYNGTTRTTGLTINPVQLLSVSMNPSTVKGGTSATGTVTLNSPAVGTSTQRRVTLSDNSLFSTTPASVTVNAGATTATFTVTTSLVATSTAVTITATYNGSTQTATLTITP